MILEALQTLEIDAGQSNIDLETLKKDFRNTNIHSRTLLHLAAALGRLDWVEQLIQEKYNVNDLDKLGHTALYYASAIGALDVVTSLIEAGSNIN